MFSGWRPRAVPPAKMWSWSATDDVSSSRSARRGSRLYTYPRSASAQRDVQGKWARSFSFGGKTVRFGPLCRNHFFSNRSRVSSIRPVPWVRSNEVAAFYKGPPAACKNPLRAFWHSRLGVRGGPPLLLALSQSSTTGKERKFFTDSFTGSVGGTQSMGSPFATFVPTTPPGSVTVVSVDTVTLSQPPTGSLTTPDATINTTTSSTITIQASYIPVGTVVTLHVFSDNNTDQMKQTTPLAGSLQSSTATATVTFPSGYSLNYVKATWTQ